MVKLGLVQMRCSMDPLENLDKAEKMIREAAAARSSNRLPPGNVHHRSIFVRSKITDIFSFGEEIPGPTTARLGEIAKELERGHHRAAFRETRSRPLS